MYKLYLEPNDKISIGVVVASYTPSSDDIDLEYLEIYSSQDTILLIGKNAIFTTIQKIEKLDWRIFVK